MKLLLLLLCFLIAFFDHDDMADSMIGRSSARCGTYDGVPPIQSTMTLFNHRMNVIGPDLVVMTAFDRVG